MSDYVIVKNELALICQSSLSRNHSDEIVFQMLLHILSFSLSLYPAHYQTHNGYLSKWLLKSLRMTWARTINIISQPTHIIIYDVNVNQIRLDVYACFFQCGDLRIKIILLNAPEKLSLTKQKNESQHAPQDLPSWWAAANCKSSRPTITDAKIAHWWKKHKPPWK